VPGITRVQNVIDVCTAQKFKDGIHRPSFPGCRNVRIGQHPNQRGRRRPPSLLPYHIRPQGHSTTHEASSIGLCSNAGLR
jgi:hypothetical protein